MGLSIECLKSLKNRDEADLYELATALLQVQDAILRLEMEETNPTILKELAGRALASGEELDEILAILSENA
jgi:hypothetical protein